MGISLQRNTLKELVARATLSHGVHQPHSNNKVIPSIESSNFFKFLFRNKTYGIYKSNKWHVLHIQMRNVRKLEDSIGGDPSPQQYKSFLLWLRTHLYLYLLFLALFPSNSFSTTQDCIRFNVMWGGWGTINAEVIISLNSH